MKKAKLDTSKSGYSLVEAVVGLAIFGLLAAGIASASMLTSRIAVSNVYGNTAHAIAQGYAEQIKSITYDKVRRAYDDPAQVNIPCMSLSVEGVDSLDVLTFGQRLEKEIVVDLHRNKDGSEKERMMRMWVTAVGNDLKTAPEALDAIEVTVLYEWQVIDGRSNDIRTGVIKMLKSNVSEK